MNCERCEDVGLELVFQHVSFPIHAPDQRTVTIEPFDQDAPRSWEEAEIVHRRYAAYRLCACPAGDARHQARKKREQAKKKRSKPGWTPPENQQ